MPNPQIENGYVKLANELIEAFCRINLSAYESRVLWYIIRKTYGWNKKADRLPNSQIVQATGISKGHVSRALKSLRAKNIVACSGNKQVGIQKDYSLWQIQKLPNQVTIEKLPNQEPKLPIQVTKVTYSGNKKLPNQEPQKTIKTLTKDISQKTIKTLTKKEHGEFSFGLFWEAYPRKKSKGQAEKVFAKINPDEQLLATMLATIERAKKSDDWLKEGGQYIPYPATWLNAKGWEDEIPKVESKKGAGKLPTAEELEEAWKL